jgi:hypothetical protein
MAGLAILKLFLSASTRKEFDQAYLLITSLHPFMLAAIHGLGATFEPYIQSVQSSDMNLSYESTGF